MIEERVSKRHGLRYLVRVDWQGKRYTVGTYPTKAKAKKAEREARNQIDNGTFDPNPPAPKPEPRIITVRDAMATWLDTKRGSIQPNSAVLYESAMRLHIFPAMGDRDTATLTHDEIQRQVNRWRDDGMGSRLIDRCVVILRSALARQVRIGGLPFNPAEGIIKPTVRTEKAMPAWTDEQYRAFQRVALADERYAPFWALTLLEGMRRGEALGLRWSDLHWNAGETECVAVVNQTIVQDLGNRGAALVQDRAKTTASRRSVQLTHSTIEAIRAHRDRQRFERQRLNDLWGDHDLIVTTGIGTPVNPSTIGRSLKRLIASAGVPPVSVHGLRHMAITVMLRRGVSPALVAAKAGHTDISTTTTLYGHLVTSDQAAANAAIEAALANGRNERSA